MIEKWIIYAFIGFLGYFFVNLLFKYVSTDNPLLVGFILYGTAGIAALIFLIPKMDFSISLKSILIAAAIGICSLTATIFAIKSIKLAPNPGYSVAIFSANFVLLTIISIWIFNAPLTLSKGIGVFATFIGLILLSI